jgi:hypothetical protein
LMCGVIRNFSGGNHNGAVCSKMLETHN